MIWAEERGQLSEEEQLVADSVAGLTVMVIWYWRVQQAHRNNPDGIGMLSNSMIGTSVMYA